VALTENAIVRHFAGDEPGPIGARHPAAAPFDAYPVQDGHIVIAVGDDDGYRRLAAALERPDLATDPRFRTNAGRLADHEDLKRELSATLATRPGAAWIGVLRAAGVACGPINTIADVVADPQVAARNMLVTVDDPHAGRVRVFGNPVKLSAFPDPPERPTAPDLDADRARILADFGE
jgi:CoA:oxalate CoA-transferase